MLCLPSVTVCTLLFLLTENTPSIIVSVSAEETDNSFFNVISTLYPEMEEKINMNSLYAYLIAFNVLTKVESEILGPQSTKTKTEKNQYLLSLLDSKGPQGQKVFIKALFRKKEVYSHNQLIELLKSKGVAITFESCV